MCSEWNIFSRECPRFSADFAKAKIFHLVKKLFRLRLELCPGSSFVDYGGVSLFPLTTKYLEKFNGNHTYNLENPIVASHFSKTFWYDLTSCFFSKFGV